MLSETTAMIHVVAHGDQGENANVITTQSSKHFAVPPCSRNIKHDKNKATAVVSSTTRTKQLQRLVQQPKGCPRYLPQGQLEEHQPTFRLAQQLPNRWSRSKCNLC